MIHIIETFLACIISMFVLNSCATWDWTPKPYTPDYRYESIYYIDNNDQEHEVKCTDPEFNNYVCFPLDNIADLKYQIEKLKNKCKIK